MPPRFEVRYLDIDWRDEGVPKKIDMAPLPLEVEPTGDGSLVVETTIFKHAYAWIGIRLWQTGAGPIPLLERAAAAPVPLLRIVDPRDAGGWWVLADGWDQAKRRHLSELRRSAGDFRVRIGAQELVIRNQLSQFGRADIQAYVDDFRGNLLWMILNDEAGATASGGGGLGVGLTEALEDFRAAARRVIAEPGKIVREAAEPTAVSRLRATAGTFREYARNPSARRMIGRVFHESADNAENRYLRHLLGLATGWIDAYQAGAEGQWKFLKTMARIESDHARDARGRTHRDVDPEMFDSQTMEISERLKALRSCATGQHATARRAQKFLIRLTRRYANEPAFFYERPDDQNGRRPRFQFAYRVVALPRQVFDVVHAALPSCKDYTFEGLAQSRPETNASGKTYLRLEFSDVYGVTLNGDPLARRARKREGIESNGWKVAISGDERKELQREATIAERRAARACDEIERIDNVIAGFADVRRALSVMEHELAGWGVGRSDVFPMGMVFITNPAYAQCLAAFHRLEELLRHSGVDQSLLGNVGKTGILHASDLYEKWCLLMLGKLLVEDFKFEPEGRWIEDLVRAVVSGARNVEFAFSRTDVAMRVVVTYQFETPTGRRPDFLVRIFDTSDVVTAGTRLVSALVLDAKFRSSWPAWGGPVMLRELVDVKSYGCFDAKRGVFILQPCAFTVNPPASPLAWGKHCDYGARRSHGEGWVQAGVSRGGETSVEHLKRLLAMIFQQSFVEPEKIQGREDDSCWWSSRSFCVGCGAPRTPDAITSRTTKGGGTRWLLDCHACGTWTTRTHCYQCKQPLFKNGTRWTYHETLADQVTNVICPHCQAYFDEQQYSDDEP